MSEFLSNYRTKYPEYDDVSDDQLTSALHQKYVSESGGEIDLPSFQSAIGYQPPAPQAQQSLEPQALQQQEVMQPAEQGFQQPIDSASNTVAPIKPEVPMIELISEKLKNWGAGAGERFGDLSGAVLKTIETTGRGLEKKAPAGGFAWDDGDILPSYLGPEEWAARNAAPILLKGAQALEKIDLGYQQKVGWEDVKKSFSEGGALSGSAYADVLEYGLEQGIKSVPDMVAAVYALPTYIFARSGEMGEERAKNKGKDRADLEDVLEAAPYATASALLERIGAKGMTSGAKEDLGKEMLKAGLKSATARVAKSGGKALSKEAGTEAIQEGILEYVGERYGTDAKMDFAEALDRAAAGAVAGGVMGGTVGGATSVANEINFSPTKELGKALDAEIEASSATGVEQEAISALDPERSQMVLEGRPAPIDTKAITSDKEFTTDPQAQPVQAAPIDIPPEAANEGMDQASTPAERSDMERGDGDRLNTGPEQEQQGSDIAAIPESGSAKAEPMENARADGGVDNALTPLTESDVKRVVADIKQTMPEGKRADAFIKRVTDSIKDSATPENIAFTKALIADIDAESPKELDTKALKNQEVTDNAEQKSADKPAKQPAPKSTERAPKAIAPEVKRKRINTFEGKELADVEKAIATSDILPGQKVLNIYTGKGSVADNINHSRGDANVYVLGADKATNETATQKGYKVSTKKDEGSYDRVVATFDEKGDAAVSSVTNAINSLKPGGKLVAVIDDSLLKSGKAARDFKALIDQSGHSIERAETDGKFILTFDKPNNQTLSYKRQDSKQIATPGKSDRVFNAPGSNYLGLYKSTGIPERRDFVMIEGRRLNIPERPQRIEPIMRKLTQIMGQRIYFGKIKGKSQEGFYRPGVGEVRTRSKNDVEVLAHEMAHYLDVYSNVTLPNFQKLYKNKRYVDEVKALSYTNESEALQEIEGFAEFVRLWLTNSQEAQRRAPEFYDAFNKTLAKDRKLLNPMRDMQDLMHKFFFQGPDKLGQALIGKDQGFMQTFEEWRYRRDSRIRQQTIDRFHAARKIEQELTKKVGDVNESAWKMFRIANGGAEGIADYVMNYGTVNFDEQGDLNRTGKSLHDVLQPVKTIDRKPEHEKDSKIDLLMRYFAGRRALELHRQGRENLIPKETAKEWAKLGGTYPVFESIHKEYQEFNNRLMDFYVSSGMITPKGRKAMESMNKDYVPFNRIRESLTDGKGSGASGFQRLKGGTSNLNDILVNIQDGVSANIRSALNNRAKQRLYQYISNSRDGAIFATQIAPDSKLVKVYQDEMMQKIGKVLEASGVEIEGEIDLTDPGLLEFWQHGVKPQLNESGNIVDTVIINGKKKYYEVQDPLLQEMLIGMNPESYSSFMNVMFGVKNLFTRSITLGVEFMGANLVRDTVGATFISKNGFTPFVDSFKGMYSYITKDKFFQDFTKSGGGYSGLLHGSTREGQARRRISLDEFGVMTAPERILSAVDNIASAFEYGTRIGEFRLAKKAGKSDMDAAFAAREISTDFSALGSNHFLMGYIRTVPFLNAMIQSQDRIFREAFVKKQYDGNPTALAMKAFLGITVPTIALYLMNKDDDDYKQIPDYEKRTNWHIPIGGGQFVKIPRPYDVGFVFATIPELFFKYVEDDRGKEFAEGMAWTLTQMYGIDGVPAMMTGWWDLVRNKKWTGAPVVPQSLADVDARQQYTSNTSETFIRMGEATGLSPIKAEHMFKAYTGYLGGYLMWGTDHMLWDKEKFGEKPNSKPSDNIFLRRFLTPDVRPNGAAMEKFFDIKEKSDKVVATFKQTIDVRRAIKGKTEGAGKFRDDTFYGLSSKEKGVLFALNDSMNQLIKILYGKEGIKTAELKIKHDPKLSGAEKRAQMDVLWKSRNKAFMQYYKQADKALQKAKLESGKQEK